MNTEIRSDLRYGNLVEGGKVLEIRRNSVIVLTPGNTEREIDFIDVRRIILDHDWMVTLGFSKKSSENSDNGWMEYEKDGLLVVLRSFNAGAVYVNHRSLPAKFVNNLQNIYHDFFATDLMIYG